MATIQQLMFMARQENCTPAQLLTHVHRVSDRVTLAQFDVNAQESIVLCGLPDNVGTPYVTWSRDHTSGGDNHGNYCTDKVRAWFDFVDRVERRMGFVRPMNEPRFTTYFVLNGWLNGEEGVSSSPPGGGNEPADKDGWYFILREEDHGNGPHDSRDEARREAERTLEENDDEA